jgi:hypothetical protein
LTFAYRKRSGDISGGFSLYQHTPSGSALARWISDLTRVRESGFSTPELDLCGRGVIVINDIEEDALDMIAWAARQAGYRFVHIDDTTADADTVNAEPAIAHDQPTLVWIPRSFWERSSDDYLPSDSADDGLDWADIDLPPCHSRVVQLLRSSDASRPWIFFTILASWTQMPDALRRAGRFDRRIGLPYFDDLEIGQAFLSEVGGEWISHSLREAASQIGAILAAEYKDNRRRSLLCAALRRIAWRERRLLGTADVIELTVHGTGDEDRLPTTAESVYRTAVHEAGHVLAIWLDSAEKRAPVYASVTARTEYLGVVVTPYDARERIRRDNSRRDLDHRIRVHLAGRAAEVLLLGDDEVSAAGSAADLECASDLANRMFGDWGLSPRLSPDASPGDNLAVHVDPVTDATRSRVAAIARAYLERQFTLVITLLRDNAILLERLTHALASKGVLFQADMEALRNLPDAKMVIAA